MGKPKQGLAVSADVTMDSKLAEELQETARDNESLLAKARAIASGSYTPKRHDR